eukprot:gb/GECH01008494.1/.p1 GENE.gb/GECH01008494.1/~~gb/GECH01008494.1/.p1  ORF type:complete len:194 (+),score=19.27 gb/GECH01008494.1/:1-582(+)
MVWPFSSKLPSVPPNNTIDTPLSQHPLTGACTYRHPFSERSRTICSALAQVYDTPLNYSQPLQTQPENSENNRKTDLLCDSWNISEPPQLSNRKPSFLHRRLTPLLENVTLAWTEEWTVACRRNAKQPTQDEPEERHQFYVHYYTSLHHSDGEPSADGSERETDLWYRVVPATAIPALWLWPRVLNAWYVNRK